ncbi:hypothetical protein G7046_g4743 [Stylonectria norvegica]|nr:hypothetical protein G7046_g4743 [Stylonectria norvegica]
MESRLAHLQERQQERQGRLRQHRRQTSTPTGFQAVNLPRASITQQRQAASHRRGESLQIRRDYCTSSSPMKQDYVVSMGTNNTGLTNGMQDNFFPGQAQRSPDSASSWGPREMNEQCFMSPYGTPQTHRFGPPYVNSNAIHFDPYDGELDGIMNDGPVGFENMGGKDFISFNQNSASMTPNYAANLESMQHNRSMENWKPNSYMANPRERRISQSLMDRVRKYDDNVGVEHYQRPMTPPGQDCMFPNLIQVDTEFTYNNTVEASYFPPTPIGTPQHSAVKIEARGRFDDGYDESMEETLKPSRGRLNKMRVDTIFQAMPQQDQHYLAPSPTGSITLSGGQTYANKGFAPIPEYSLDNEFMKQKNGLQPLETPQFTADLYAVNSDSEFYSHTPTSINDSDSQSSSGWQTPHRRSDSMASMVSNSSTSDEIDVEASRTPTGITSDEINVHISAPDASENKWTCTFETEGIACGKKFGRKENIKSHVQTHLGDRQYKCPDCNKCFVRQHDLKRHAKIHSGAKMYECPCKKRFARHDALTRHKQRGMCIGAVEGAIRKQSRRGRPPKNARPDSETRATKSAKQRQKNMSISSTASSDNGGGQLYKMMPTMNLTAGPQLGDLASVSQAPMGCVAGPSVEYAGHASDGSVQSYVSPQAIMNDMSSHSGSPADTTTPYHSPAEAAALMSQQSPALESFSADDYTNSPELNPMSDSNMMLSTAALGGIKPDEMIENNFLGWSNGSRDNFSLNEDISQDTNAIDDEELDMFFA